MVPDGQPSRRADRRRGSYGTRSGRSPPALLRCGDLEAGTGRGASLIAARLAPQVCLMDTEAGAQALADAVGEGPALTLVKDLRYRRAVEAANVTVSCPKPPAALGGKRRYSAYARAPSGCLSAVAHGACGRVLAGWMSCISRMRLRTHCIFFGRAAQAYSTHSRLASRRLSPPHLAPGSKAPTEARPAHAATMDRGVARRN